MPHDSPDVGPLEWLRTVEFRLGLRGCAVDEVDLFIEEIIDHARDHSITSSEIRYKSFRKGLKGYRVDDVQAAMETAATQLEAL